MQQEMNTRKRIDFGLFAKTVPAPIGGGVLSDDLVTMISCRQEMQDVLQLVASDTTVHWVSDGAWSMHELLMGLLGITGPADVYISSYAMGETPARILARLKNDGVIKKLSCVLDNRIDVRTAGSLQLIKGIADRYALIDTHAKVTVIVNDDYHVAVIGSANYTENVRYEAGIITMRRAAVDLHLKWINHELDNQ